MRDSWAISAVGLDLLIELDAGTGRRAALERGLRAAVRGGRLQPGTRLPSSRTLAADLGLARGTVSEAYRQLVAEGYLVARQGAGTVVAPRQGAPPPAAGPPPRPARPRADFRLGQPDLSGFPRDAWLAATRRVLRGAASDAFGYGDPRGRPELRRALADYLGRVRGVHAAPELVVVCTGYTQGLRLVCEALRARGTASLAHEDPCIPAYRRLVASTGLATVPVPVDNDGVDVDRLAGLDAGGLLVTPAHQCPLGTTLAPARRAALLRWARDTGGVVIEDDYDGEFRYDRQPVGALQGLDPERVVYAGTASKTIAPGVRLAWLVVPPSLLEPVVDAKRCADHQSPSIDQLVLADLIGSGAFDRHVRRCRLRYRRRRDLLRAAIAERVPALRLLGVAAGLHAVALLPDDGPGEDEVLAHAASRSVALTGLGEYRHAATRPDGAAPRGIVLGYANPPEHAFGPALDALTTALAELWPLP